MENAHIGVNELIIIVLLSGAVAWSLIWKGIALWHAARNGQKGWYVALLVVNTLGLLEILYVFVLRPRPAAVAPGGAEPIGQR